MKWSFWRYGVMTLALSTLSLNSLAASSSRLSDQVIQPNYDDFQRTAPLFELGEPFLDTGNIDPGFEIPTGAIWQPQFMLFGDLRTAIQEYDNGGPKRSEWVNRLNLFGQLRLTPTERFLIGFRPLDDDGQFTGKQFEPETKTINEFNGHLDTFYFEGDFGELFPNLDPNDEKKLDWGFAIGRQPVLIQEGILINDNMDAIGIVRNSITLPGVANLRMTAFYAWNEVNRHNNQEDESAKLYALFNEFDLSCCTVNIDLVYIDGERQNGQETGDGYFLGISSVQRFGHINTSFRALYSKAKDKETPAVGTGTLLFAETSYTPAKTHNNLYFNAFYAFDQFTSASRRDGMDGPLGRTGILFAAAGMGRYGSALNNQAFDAYGASLGYQMFFSGNRKQLILELGARDERKGFEDSAVAAGVRYQQAFGKHTIAVLDGFISDSKNRGSGHGARLELRWKF